MIITKKKWKIIVVNQIAIALAVSSADHLKGPSSHKQNEEIAMFEHMWFCLTNHDVPKGPILLITYYRSLFLKTLTRHCLARK